MANFEQAINRVLAQEGGFVDHPHDPGGATHYGISARYLNQHAQYRQQYDLNRNGVVDSDDMRQLTREQAIAIYAHDWWLAFGYARIDCDALASKLLDIAINIGQQRAVRLLQAAYNQLGRPGTPLRVDGQMGANTVAALNQRDTANAVLAQFRANVSAYYTTLVARHPQLRVFAAGWQKRAWL